MGHINPYFYIIFVFVFPVKNSKTILLISSFLLGLFIDILTNDGGIHTFSLVLISYIRLPFLRIITGKSDLDQAQFNIRDLSLPVLITWITILTLLHHFFLFLLEQFSFAQFGNLLLKTLLSSLFSIVLIIFGLQLFLKRRSNA